MSKFFGRAGQSDSDSDSDSGSEEEVQQTKQSTHKGFGVIYSDSDSDSEEEVRVVISSVDRARNAIREGVVKVNNGLKTNDWPAIEDNFAEVNKLVEKNKSKSTEGYPVYYIKMLVSVEDSLSAQLKDKEGMKKLKPVVSHAINRMKLIVKRHNEKFKEDIQKCRADPSAYDDAAPAPAPVPAPAPAPAPTPSPAAAAGGDDDEEEDDLVFDEDEDDAPVVDISKKTQSGRAFWLLSEEEYVKKMIRFGRMPPSALNRFKVVKEKDDKKVSVVDGDAAAVDASEELDIRSDPKFSAIGPAFIDENVTEEVLDRKLRDLIVNRGRKNTDVKDLLQKLELLARVSRRFGPTKEIPVLMHLISAMYDSHRSIDDYMKLDQWRTCCECLTRVTALLRDNQHVVLGLIPLEDLTDLAVGALAKRKEEVKDNTVETDASGITTVRVVGTLAAFVSRLDDEYTKSLQQINPHTRDYVCRLSDEAALIDLAEAVYTYYRRIRDDKSASILALLQVELLYYKHESIIAAIRRGRGASSEVSSAARLEQLCQFIFRTSDERSKTRALLCSVFSHALHDRFYQARDLFLMSHVQDTIDKADTSTQILYNRALVTMGLCAFRMGLIQKAHDCLAGICSGRVKELLAQGPRWNENIEQEKIERRRQIPYHMHINPDLLEGCHMISAMFLELPSLCRSSTSTNTVSKPFRKYLLSYNRQVFVGPPENIREHVLAAAKSLLAGDWARACDLILNLEVWNLIPGDGSSRVKDMLREKLKEEAVRIFLISNGCHYQSLALPHICSMFAVDPYVAKRLISRMLFQKEISGAWDRDLSTQTDTLLLYHVEPSPLQALSQQLSEKLVQLVDSNERLLDPILNGYAFKEERGGERGGDNYRRQNWNSSSSADQTQGQNNERRRMSGLRTSRPQVFRQGGRQGGPGRGSGGGRGGGPGSGAAGRSSSQWGGKVNVSNRPQQAQQDVPSSRPISQLQTGIGGGSGGANGGDVAPKKGWGV